MAEAKYRCWDRPWEALSADIERFHLDTIMDRINLQLHIAATWTIHEILRFKADMCSVKNEDRDEVRRSRPHNDLVEYSGGLVVSSKRELRSLIGIFDTLRAKAFALIGIKTYRKLDSETPIDSVLLFASDDINDDPYSMTLDELERSIPKADGVFAEMRKGFDKINAALQAQGADVASTRTGVAFLVNDRKGKIKTNRKRGAENQAKGIDADRKRAAADMNAALDRVRRRIADAEKNGKRAIVLVACRAVCKEFTAKTKKKNALGKCADGYYPLTGADGKPIKPETLAKNYRDRYGGKRGNRKKAVAVK